MTTFKAKRWPAKNRIMPDEVKAHVWWIVDWDIPDTELVLWHNLTIDHNTTVSPSSKIPFKRLLKQFVSRLQEWLPSKTTEDASCQNTSRTVNLHRRTNKRVHREPIKKRSILDGCLWLCLPYWICIWLYPAPQDDPSPKNAPNQGQRLRADGKLDQAQPMRTTTHPVQKNHLANAISFSSNARKVCIKSVNYPQSHFATGAGHVHWPLSKRERSNSEY